MPKNLNDSQTQNVEISSLLGLTQFIPRGSVLKNSLRSYAMVVYTGTDTKLALNEGKYRSKISNISYQLNIFFACNVGVMIFMAFTMSQIGNRAWNKNLGPQHYYIFDEVEGSIDIGGYASKTFMSFFLLFCMILPLDMAIT
jgi:hypothetical protein